MLNLVFYVPLVKTNLNSYQNRFAKRSSSKNSNPVTTSENCPLSSTMELLSQTFIKRFHEVIDTFGKGHVECCDARLFIDLWPPANWNGACGLMPDSDTIEIIRVSVYHHH